MGPTRREFIKSTAVTAATVAACGPLALQARAQTPTPPDADPAAIEIANEALNAARKAGASYADVRIGRYRRQIDRHARTPGQPASATASRTASASARSSTAAGALPRRAR